MAHLNKLLFRKGSWRHLTHVHMWTFLF